METCKPSKDVCWKSWHAISGLKWIKVKQSKLTSHDDPYDNTKTEEDDSHPPKFN